MSNAVSAIMVPHPPILLPLIGKGEEKKISDIDQAYRMAAKELAASKPDTVIIVSPHAPCYYDYIQLSAGPFGKGNLGQFGDFQDRFEIEYDQPLVKEIERLAQKENIPAGTLGRQDGSLDHGTMIPLYYLMQELPASTRYIRIGTGGPDNLMHYRLGELVSKAAGNLHRKIAVVGSGDLSHCQKENSSYGYKSCGPAYDAMIMDIMGRGDFEALLEISDQTAQEAMVCGQKPFSLMAGVLDGLSAESRALAHSAEFGVGYGVCTYTGLKHDESRHFADIVQKKKAKALQQKKAGEDPWVQLARRAVETFVTTGQTVTDFSQVPSEIVKDHAGAFVSLHKDGQLRGCIGTIAPAADNLAQEIVCNGISACSRDPRFPSVADWELEDLEYSVDVLQPPVPVADIQELDPKKYGVIVTKGSRRGLLLPNLDGVDSVETQLAIARQKAGISPKETGVTLEKFEVVRHL